MILFRARDPFILQVLSHKLESRFFRTKIVFCRKVLRIEDTASQNIVALCRIGIPSLALIVSAAYPRMLGSEAGSIPSKWTACFSTLIQVLIEKRSHYF